MKKSLAILTFLAASFPMGSAFAANTEPVPVTDAAPRMLELINRERAAAGLAGLALDDEVTAIAARWSREMALAGRLSHNDEYLSAQSMERLDATTVGENVAFADSVDEIHALLMDSPPHRANILNGDFRLVGVAAVRSPSGELFLTEDFLTRRAARPAEAAPPPREHRAAPSRPAKPAARPAAKPAARPAAKPPTRRPAESRARAAAPARTTRPAASSAPTAPPTASAPPSRPAPPPPAPEDVAPVEVTAPAPSEPLGEPETPSDAGGAEGFEIAADPTTEPDAVQVEAPTLDETAQRQRGRSAGDLVKGLPALLLVRRRWFGGRH